MQADIATMQRTEGELRTEWTRTREESSRAHEELAALRAMSGGNSAKVGIAMMYIVRLGLGQG